MQNKEVSEESAKAHPARYLVRGLDPDIPYPERLRAARALGEIETSDVDIVRALLAAKERDPSYQVRQATAEAVRSPVHAAVLAQHPELQPAVDAAVHYSMPRASAAVGGVAAPPAAAGVPTDERSAASPLIPWLTIWIWPRRTIRQIVDADPKYRLWIVGALVGIAQGLDTASRQNVGDDVPLLIILVLAALLGPLGWIAGIYFSGFFLRSIGRWLGGVADAEEMRAALMWASVPNIASLGVWAIGLVLFGRDMFTFEGPKIGDNLLLALIAIALSLALIVLSLWRVVLSVMTVAEVHRFSIWRSLATWAILLGAAVILVVAMLWIGNIS